MVDPAGYLDFIALEAGPRLVGCDPSAIVAAALTTVLQENVEPRNPALWDGKAGERIGQVLLGGGGAKGRLRPTDVPAS